VGLVLYNEGRRKKEEGRRKKGNAGTII